MKTERFANIFGCYFYRNFGRKKLRCGGVCTTWKYKVKCIDKDIREAVAQLQFEARVKTTEKL